MKKLSKKKIEKLVKLLQQADECNQLQIGTKDENGDPDRGISGVSTYHLGNTAIATQELSMKLSYS